MNQIHETESLHVTIKNYMQKRLQKLSYSSHHGGYDTYSSINHSDYPDDDDRQ